MQQFKEMKEGQIKSVTKLFANETLLTEVSLKSLGLLIIFMSVPGHKHCMYTTLNTKIINYR